MRAWGVVCLALVSCGGGADVHVHAPVARYDHNRSRPLCVVMSDEPAPCVPPVAAPGVAGPPVAQAPKLRFGAESYAPQSRAPYDVQYAQGAAGEDGLPPAQLVPIYTGVALPLSSAPIAGCAMCVSDRSDLTDYLASGPGALAGVDAPDTQGDTASTAAKARPVLDLLSRKDVTSLSREQLEEAFSRLGVERAGRVYDSRYPAAAVADVCAFRWDAFWFVLYRFPEKKGFTRLVVVPTGLAQDLRDKRPSSQPLPQELPIPRGNR